MEVTSSNFEVVFPLFKQLLKSCDFYAIDMEMTGIRLNDVPPPTDPLMTPEEEFSTNFAVAKKFSPIQLGVCTFHRLPDTIKTQAAAFSAQPLPSSLSADETKVLKSFPTLIADSRTAIRNVKDSTEAVKIEKDLNDLQSEVFDAFRDLNDAKPSTGADDFGGVNAKVERTAFMANLLGELAAAGNALQTVKDVAAANGGAIPAAGASSASGEQQHLKDDMGLITGNYEVRPFSFYIFPSESGDMVMDRSTVNEFLSKHGMDFSKWINSGIPYVTREKADEIRQTALRRYMFQKDKNKKFDQSLLGEIPKEDMRVVTDLMAEIDKVVAGKDPNWNVRVPYLKNQVTYNVLDKYRDAEGLVWTIKQEKGKNIKFLSLPEEETAGGDDDDDGAETNDTINVIARAEKDLGATLVMEAMIDCRKPIVAHNSFKDFLFLYTAFHRTALARYDDFKLFLRTSFPLLIDTKALVNLDAVHDPKMIHMLQREYEFFRDMQSNSKQLAKGEAPPPPISFKFPLGFEAFHPKMLARPESKAAHDAGYDAWMCGALALFARKALFQKGLSALNFCNSIPSYGLVYSCQIHHDEDAVPHDGPLLHITCPRGGRLDMGRLTGILSKNNLDGRIGPQYDNRAVFVSADAKGTGSMLEGSIDKLQTSLDKHFNGAKVGVLEYDPARWVKQTKGGNQKE